MTALINNNKYNRFIALNELYSATNGNTSHHQDLRELASKKGLINGDLKEAYNYLKEEGLIKPFGMGYNVSITHIGVKAIEAAHTKPNEATQYFPSLKEMGL